MSDTKYSAEIRSLNNGPWDELYVLTQYWKSDLEFYGDDLRFLHHLIDKYFMWIIKAENLNLVKGLKRGLLDLNNKSKDLLDKVGRHRVQLGYMVENPNKADARTIKLEHEHLEKEMAQYVKLFRENRKEVFAITEYVIDSEELANMMDP